MNYCEFAALQDENNVHRIYHDLHYGTPLTNDNELFGRLILEINQAGLSWSTILNKEANFRAAFDHFDIEKIAEYDQEKFDELMNNAGIIRNRLKINAVIHNAQQVIEIQKEFGTFKHWLDQHGELTKLEWVKIFKKRFKFVGGEIVNEFLMSLNYLPGAHHPGCFRYIEYK
ncbi:MAG: DNA-3-methyladenine glycosylase I [Fluviicola sp.]|nr:DNA-3-methyladenine glycosylase I [Fluviicola sp.]MBP6272373.1 DNA-3-methyladenine glycosylase I [Fluviicola sp.]